MEAFQCECCQHCLTLDKNLNHEGEITIWCWDCAGNVKPSLWWRFKMCWRLLRTGDLHGDHVILSRENMGRLGHQLINLSEGEP